MAEQKCMNHLSETLERVKLSGEEGGNYGPMEKLESYSTLLKDCTKAVQGNIPSCKFNNEQCGYLADKIEVVVQSANSFLKDAKHHAKKHPCSSEDVAKWVEIFNLLLTLAKQIESFVRSCCEDAWIEAAMTLTNMSEYISSLGFNVELYRIALSKERAALSKECSAIRGSTSAELGNINITEVEIVKLRAIVDLETLFREVKMRFPSFRGKTRDLATCLLQRLSGDEPCATSDYGSFLSSLFNLVKQEQLLGRGATGAVYKSTWLGISVAKKMFDGQENLDFLEEVEILSPLRHPNITSMFCCIKTEQSCSIIMELMDGDLHALMRRRDSPPFPILESVNIMCQIGEGVNYLHNKTIVHRDLKSRKILVKESETGYIHAKVADIGLSKTRL